MPDASELLKQANDCHDDDPDRGAALIRQIDTTALLANERPLLGFLFNHVLGEKFGLWREAHQRQQALLTAAGADEQGLVLLRHAAVAARLGSDAAAADRSLQSLAEAAGSPRAAADTLVKLAAASFTVPGLAAAEAGACTLDAFASVEAWHVDPVPALDVSFAAITNNLGSHLAERAIADLQDPALREAMAQAAAHALRFWARAGNWVQHERACYLAALAANALGDASQAAEHARSGLALLDVRDSDAAQQVDRAFLEQELAHALESVDDLGANAARARAIALAADFGDEGLTNWFNDRAQRQAALRVLYRV